MLCGVVSKNIDMGKREVILRDFPVQVSVVHTHMYLTILLRYWNDISNPLWIGGDNQESGVELFLNFILDLFLHLRAHPANLLLYQKTLFFSWQTMNHNMSILSWHIFV